MILSRWVCIMPFLLVSNSVWNSNSSFPTVRLAHSGRPKRLARNKIVRKV